MFVTNYSTVKVHPIKSINKFISYVQTLHVWEHWLKKYEGDPILFFSCALSVLYRQT